MEERCKTIKSTGRLSLKDRGTVKIVRPLVQSLENERGESTSISMNVAGGIIGNLAYVLYIHIGVGTKKLTWRTCSNICPAPRIIFYCEKSSTWSRHIYCEMLFDLDKWKDNDPT